MTNEANVILEVKNLNVEFTTDDGIVHAVNNVSYKVERGKTLAIVGESGSGKSVSSLAVMGLVTGSNSKITGEVFFNGRELVGADPEEVRKLRGDEMAMIFQDPLSALHP
jgi:peptide/nickel transport system ATP-binding protein